MIEHADGGLLFTVTVQPRASKNAVAGRHGDTLKIRLTAPPVDGAANKACIAFLAKQLGVAKSALEIVSGHTSRTKRILCRCRPASAAKGGCLKVAAALNALFAT
ncbi:MAG: DUF167 domain-containing protein [Pseudomonadota bacterium]